MKYLYAIVQYTPASKLFYKSLKSSIINSFRYYDMQLFKSLGECLKVTAEGDEVSSSMNLSVQFNWAWIFKLISAMTCFILRVIYDIAPICNVLVNNGTIVSLLFLTIPV